MTITRRTIETALHHLHSADPVLRNVIAQVGPFRLKGRRNRFHSLVRAIIFQQISGSAGQSILTKLERLLGPKGITPEQLLRFTPTQLRTAGVSPQKAGYLLDLAAKVASGEVQLEKISRLSNDDIIIELTKIKGIGVWTAQMFLMFSLKRIDVFPHGDLGIRSALKKMYGLRDLPDEKKSHQIARSWRPYATVASWYCWRSLELPK